MKKFKDLNKKEIKKSFLNTMKVLINSAALKAFWLLCEFCFDFFFLTKANKKENFFFRDY